MVADKDKENINMNDKAQKLAIDHRSIRETACNTTAGAATGVLAATFVCPLDVIKVRFQVLGLPLTPLSGRQRGTVIIRSLHNIVKNEGVKGMYRGLTPTMLALTPNWAFYFGVYGKLKNVLQSNDGKLSIGANILASAIAGASTNIATNPLWVVHTRLVIQGLRPNVVPYKTLSSAFTRIYHEEGIRGFYSGLVPSLMGVSHVVIQFPAFEMIKQYMAHKGNTSVDMVSPTDTVLASFIAKTIASVMTYPHEVIRSKLQEQRRVKNVEGQYTGVIDCIKKVYKIDGVHGFYRGCVINLVRSVPQGVITLTGFEMINKYLQQVVLSEKIDIEYS